MKTKNNVRRLLQKQRDVGRRTYKSGQEKWLGKTLAVVLPPISIVKNKTIK